MKYLTSMLAILNITIGTKSQTSNLDNIKEILIYDYFVDKGFTTNTAYSHFENMEKLNITKIRLEKEYVDSLKYIISKSKIKKLSQTKTGTFILFAEFIYADNSISKVTIQTNLICNYTLKEEYWIKDPEHQKWILEFKKMLKNLHN